MRSLQRNWREIYYAVPMGSEPIVDEYGNDTLEVRQIYSDPGLLPVNISANAGQDAVNTFGSQTEYSRTISYAGMNCPLTEGSLVWFGVDITGKPNYRVVKVADSKNGYLIALREVAAIG
jgi:hypothetical protein